MSKQILKRIMLLFFGLGVVSMGTALSIRAGLGQGAVNAFAVNLEMISSIKAGTTLTMINFICFGLQIILLRKDFKWVQVLQIPLAVLFGWLVNFVTYDLSVIVNYEPETYFLKAITLMIALICSTFGVGMMLKADLICLPFESFCTAIMIVLDKSFSQVRPFVEGFFLIISVLIMIVFGLPNTTVREGTIVYTLFFGKLSDYFKDRVS